jgi:hypothetical protein
MVLLVPQTKEQQRRRVLLLLLLPSGEKHGYHNGCVFCDEGNSHMVFVMDLLPECGCEVEIV